MIFCSHLRPALVIFDVAQSMQLNPFIICMTSPLAWSQWGWPGVTYSPHMPKGNADELRSLPGLTSVASLCGFLPTKNIYTGDNFFTKTSFLVSLFLICRLSLSKKVHGSVKCLFGMPLKGQQPLLSLIPACSRYPCRHGASEDYADGHWDGCPCMWPPKQPLDIMSSHTTLLPEPHRTTDPSCWHRTHQAPHPCKKT